MSIAENHFIEENGGSDSEANSDDGSDYYQPISSLEDDQDPEDHQQQQPHVNGSIVGAENGISDLHVNDEEKEEEEEREEAIWRAFREDENRRNAPLGTENAVRIMEAMRGVSFGGFSPDWVSRVPEDRWVDQLARLRQPSPPPPSTSQN